MTEEFSTKLAFLLTVADLESGYYVNKRRLFPFISKKYKCCIWKFRPVFQRMNYYSYSFLILPPFHYHLFQRDIPKDVKQTVAVRVSMTFSIVWLAHNQVIVLSGSQFFDEKGFHETFRLRSMMIFHLHTFPNIPLMVIQVNSGDPLCVLYLSMLSRWHSSAIQSSISADQAWQRMWRKFIWRHHYRDTAMYTRHRRAVKCHVWCLVRVKYLQHPALVKDVHLWVIPWRIKHCKLPAASEDDDVGSSVGRSPSSSTFRKNGSSEVSCSIPVKLARFCSARDFRTSNIVLCLWCRAARPTFGGVTNKSGFPARPCRISGKKQ